MTERSGARVAGTVLAIACLLAPALSAPTDHSHVAPSFTPTGRLAAGRATPVLATVHLPASPYSLVVDAPTRRLVALTAPLIAERDSQVGLSPMRFS